MEDHPKAQEKEATKVEVEKARAGTPLARRTRRSSTATAITAAGGVIGLASAGPTRTAKALAVRAKEKERRGKARRAGGTMAEHLW